MRRAQGTPVGALRQRNLLAAWVFALTCFAMWRLALPLLAVVMMACGAQTTIGLTHDASAGGPDATQDAGWVDVDAGSGPSDAGVSPDAGGAPDAGTDLDAGAAPDGGNPDGGGDDPDAGTNADAGSDLDASVSDASVSDASDPDAGTNPDATVPDANDPDAGRDICADLAPCCRRLNGRDRRICEAAVASGDPARCEQAMQAAQQQGVCLP